MKRRNRYTMKRILGSPVALVVAVLLFVLLARAAWSMVDRSEASAERLAQAQAQYDKIQDSQKSLSDKVAELSAPGGVEADLREKYHAVAPGESVAVIVDDGLTASPSDSRASSTPAGQSWWQRLLGFFGI